MGPGRVMESDLRRPKLLAFTSQPRKIDDGLPAGGGQAMLRVFHIDLYSVCYYCPALVGLLKLGVTGAVDHGLSPVAQRAGAHRCLVALALLDRPHLLAA